MNKPEERLSEKKLRTGSGPIKDGSQSVVIFLRIKKCM